MKSQIKKFKTDILNYSFLAGACHIGSALSCIEILNDIFYKKLKKEDVFLFSKASGAAALYVILADKGYFDKKKLTDYLKNYPLAHKDVPGVIHSVGSIGHGLPVAVGIALGKKLKKEEGDVHVLISDGELNEGTSYEAALFASQHKLKNLHVWVDDNGIQACDFTRDVLNLDTAIDFFSESFHNFHHNYTIKGDGISFMEDKVEWHYKNLDEELLEKALEEL